MNKKKTRVVGFLQWNKPSLHQKHDNPNMKSKNRYSPQPYLFHALIVIFLEYFSWGLVMSPVITVLNDMFPEQAFLMNGLIQGVKGMLSFLSAPLIGALSDVWGRRPFLLLTVAFTCAPIPLMRLFPWWYFAMLSLSGIFSVTFSIVFAYVADVTSEEERSSAYGLVSATFAASLVTSPAIGAYLGRVYSDNLVVALASAVALLDVFFVITFVPESLPEKVRPSSWGSNISWEKADPFGALRRLGKDFLVLMLCVTVFFSYLPEAGEYSSFFVYLRLVMNFDSDDVALFMAVVGIMSVVSQTIFLPLMLKYFGIKKTIIVGLLLQMFQLFLLGFGSQHWIIWMAGFLGALSSLTYPSISLFVSAHASEDQQGVAQGVITGVRGLCYGLGPALFGFIFYLFHVDLSDSTNRHITPSFSFSTHSPPWTVHNLTSNKNNHNSIFNPPPPFASNFHRNQNYFNNHKTTPTFLHHLHETIMPGPPFAFGAILVILALLVALFIPENPHSHLKSPVSMATLRKPSVDLNDYSGSGHGKEPLILTSVQSA